MKKVFLSSLVLFSIFSCQQSGELKSSGKKLKGLQKISEVIKKPLKKLEIEPEIYKIDSEKASSIKLPSGSKLEIPANCFVDKNGNPIQGEISIKWNEYHTLTDILLSGIPMKYDSLGKDNDLVSGGMFEITGSQKNEEIQIAPNKSVKVDIASINDSPCMNFYALNEKTGDWQYKTTKVAKPIQKVETSNDTQNLASILDIQVDTDSFPELKNKMIVGWKSLDGLTQKEQIEIKQYNIYKLQKLNDKQYNIVASSRKNSKSYIVEPYLFDEAKRNSSHIEKLIQKDYSNLLEKQNKMEKRTFVRSINIKGFGIFNWDVCNKVDREKIIAKVNFPHEAPTKSVAYFLITPKDNSIVRYDPETLDKFSFNPRSENCFVAILPDNSLYVCSARDFKKSKRKFDVLNIDLIKSAIEIDDQADLTSSLKSLF